MMKKACLILLAMSMVFGAAACKTTKTTADSTTPEWLNDLPPADVLWGIGVCKLPDPMQTMEFAEMRARVSIARQLNTVVQVVLVETQAPDPLKEEVTLQITNVTFTGAQPKPIKQWVAPDGTFWCLVEYKKPEAKAIVTGILKDKEATYPSFKAQEALEHIDTQFAKSEKALVVDR